MEKSRKTTPAINIDEDLDFDLCKSQQVDRSQDGDDEMSDRFNPDADYEISCGEDLFMELCEAWLDQHGSEVLEKVLNKPRKKQVTKDGFYSKQQKK